MMSEKRKIGDDKNTKESPSIDAEVIKGIQAQIASLTQWDKLKKVGLIHPYPQEYDSIPYPPKFKPLKLHTYDDKSLPTNTSITFGPKSAM